MSSSEAATCLVLTGSDNFQIWKIRVMAKLWHEKTCQLIPTTNSWLVHDSKAVGIIIAYVSDRFVIEIGVLPHTKDMFDRLVKIHKGTNVGISAFYTFIYMLTLKWDGSPSTLSNHISVISAANAKLTAMKKQVNPEFLAFILLHSLPDKTMWESFHATVLNLLAPGKALSFPELSDCLTFTARSFLQCCAQG
ncbi:hypothetical protein H2248_012170 [Termitomyces sp. 'cryptogamus']|nr:hypothetical protein H2248_012170 [Termitomyces sp. 'cryptogamus']